VPVLPRFDLRMLAADALRFAREFPAVAGKIAHPSGDPTTEHLVNGSHYLAGTVLDKVEDYLVEAHEILAQRTSPWLRLPIPSATVVAFEPEASPRFTVPRATSLHVVRDGTSLVFHPIAPVVLPGCHVRRAYVDANSGPAPVLCIELASTTGSPLNEDLGQGISFFVDGNIENALEVVHALTTGLRHGFVDSPDWKGSIPFTCDDVERTGLSTDESLSPDPDGLPWAFGVMSEVFLCPHRFRFFRVLPHAACASAKATARVTLRFVLERPLSEGATFTEREVRTHCAAVVNLFETTGDPLRLDFERGPLPVRVTGMPPSGARAYAVRSAWAASTEGDRVIALPDVRRLGAASVPVACPAAFATALRGSAGQVPVMTIAFSRIEQAERDESDWTVSLNLLATNGETAASLRAGDLSGAVELGEQRIAFRNLVATSKYASPPMGDAFLRRAVRAAAVPTGRGDLLVSLKDTLFLAVPSDMGRDEEARAIYRCIDALRGFEVSVARRLLSGGAVVRGYLYSLRVDESAFRGVGELSLFGAALAEALARTTAVNTFTELVVHGIQTGRETMYRQRRST
jgi:type VI secretion system protein ImpG